MSKPEKFPEHGFFPIIYRELHMGIPANSHGNNDAPVNTAPPRMAR